MEASDLRPRTQHQDDPDMAGKTTSCSTVSRDWGLPPHPTAIPLIISSEVSPWAKPTSTPTTQPTP